MSIWRSRLRIIQVADGYPMVIRGQGNPSLDFFIDFLLEWLYCPATHQWRLDSHGDTPRKLPESISRIQLDLMH